MRMLNGRGPILELEIQRSMHHHVRLFLKNEPNRYQRTKLRLHKSVQQLKRQKVSD